MRVLWLCSFAPGCISEALGKEKSRFGGWIDGALKEIVKTSDTVLGVCYPQTESKEMISGQTKLCSYYGIHFHGDPELYDPDLIPGFQQVYDRFCPDVIHIWGAEFPFFTAAVEAAAHKIPVVCSIQGLCGVYAYHYYGHLPESIIRRNTFRDLLRMDNLPRQRRKYEQRGVYEKRILAGSDSIIGRTDWDKACASLLAPGVPYVHCNETLRDVFYQNADKWSYDVCEKHSVFVSQSLFPVKGFHMAIQAVSLLAEKYPDLVLYTTGESPFDTPWYRIGTYQRYIKKQLTEKGLKDRVKYLGALDAQKMCRRYLMSNVFVSASSIENSPNSVGEAMLLGMPVVASYVGGTMNLLEDKIEGYLYQADAPYMLAAYIDAVFQAGESAKAMGSAASEHARKTHDPRKNALDLWTIYRQAQKCIEIGDCKSRTWSHERAPQGNEICF